MPSEADLPVRFCVIWAPNLHETGDGWFESRSGPSPNFARMSMYKMMKTRLDNSRFLHKFHWVNIHG